MGFDEGETKPTGGGALDRVAARASGRPFGAMNTPEQPQAAWARVERREAKMPYERLLEGSRAKAARRASTSWALGAALSLVGLEMLAGAPAVAAMRTLRPAAGAADDCLLARLALAPVWMLEARRARCCDAARNVENCSPKKKKLMDLS